MTDDASRRSDELREALKRFMKKRGLKPTPWAERAGLSRGALPNFLSGRARTLHRETLQKLADCEKVSIAELTGDVHLDDHVTSGIVDSPTGEDAMNQLIVQLLRQLVAQQEETNRRLAALSEQLSSPSTTQTATKKAS